MKNQEQITAQNTWNNESIAMRYAEDNIEYKYIAMFYLFVRRSFGYGKRYTNRITTKEISKLTKLSEPTVISYIKYLTENGFVMINKSTRFIKDGGSEANSYSPCYPKGYGKLFFKEDINNSGSDTKTKEPEVNKGYVYDENKQF